MTRSELVAKIAAENPKLTQAEADKIVRMIFDSMTETLAQGGRVQDCGASGYLAFGNAIHERVATQVPATLLTLRQRQCPSLRLVR